MTEPERYTCEDVFRRLDDFLDRELGPDEHQPTISSSRGLQGRGEAGTMRMRR